MNAVHSRIRRLFPLLVLAGMAFSASTASGGVNVWTTSGPKGGDTRALAIDPTTPSTVYAGSYGRGVIKSLDRGGSWSETNAGLTSDLVLSLAIDPSAPATIYAGTQQGGICKSTNGGKTWSALGLTDSFAARRRPRSTPARLTPRGSSRAPTAGRAGLPSTLA